MKDKKWLILGLLFLGSGLQAGASTNNQLSTIFDDLGEQIAAIRAQEQNQMADNFLKQLDNDFDQIDREAGLPPVQHTHNTIHKRIHINQNPFKCKICKMTFTRAFSLNEHQLVHTGIKRFECKTCNKKFGRNREQLQHTITPYTINNACSLLVPRKTKISLSFSALGTRSHL